MQRFFQPKFEPGAATSDRRTTILRFLCFLSLLACALGTSALAQTPGGLHWWPPSQREAEAAFESAVNSIPTTSSLRNFHELLCSEPHIAGTPGDAREIQRIATAFTSMGLDSVQVDEFWALLSKPIEAKLEIVAPAPMSLPLKEDVLPQDSYSSHADLTFGFNAYSGSGDVTAEVVYANYGTKEDFAKLKELGVDVTGKIVLARYGGNFRGYKAKFAEAAGAAGLIIYTDPTDGGYCKGLVYPDGGWANETCIQRGSINTLDYAGDPLTPGEPALENAQRLDPDKIALPRIPVQPIGYGAAREIMQRMKGAPLPQDQPELIKAWQGGLSFAYRLTGGSDLKVRLMVKQERSIVKSSNVVAMLRGTTFPDQKIVIGCHHDAWGYGAGDPLAGTILVLEAARSFAEAAKNGRRPARSIVFATWGGEEYGIIGSTEYCEKYRDDLSKNAVAYINLDAATMGPNFGSSASPSLKRIIEEVAREIPQARNTGKKTVHQVWLGDREEPEFGNLGGGSDHVGFYCHLGIPSCQLGASGGPGNSYHSNYDDLTWYRKVVGEDYEPALMLARIVNLLALRLANAVLLPLDPVHYGADCSIHLEALEHRAKQLQLNLDLTDLMRAAQQLERASREVEARILAHLEKNEIAPAALDQINAIVLQLERQWLSPEDDHSGARGWFRNLYAQSDPDSGYAACMLPGMRTPIEQKNAAMLETAEKTYRIVLDKLGESIRRIDGILDAQHP